jgi:phage recombination protein Bet
MNDVAIVSQDELVAVLRSSLYPGAKDESIRMALSYCRAAGLDPLQKPVHIVPMWDSKAAAYRDVVMPGIGLYRTQASRTGEAAGVSEPEFGPDVTEVIGGQEITFPAWCRVTVFRLLPNGATAQFTAREFWRENYAVKGGREKSIAPNAMWTKRPYGQLAKCAEAQALRKAFPELGAAPTAEEMEGKVIDGGAAEVVSSERAEPRVVEAPPAYPAEAFAANLPKWHALIDKGRSADEIIATIETKGRLTAQQKCAIRRDDNVIQGEAA